jgi:predicted nucleotidyltransferase
VSLVEKLKRYFSKRQEVAFSFLFGSQARGSASKLSDVDIAVFFYPEKRHPLEYEEEVFYATEDEIWADLERLLNREVELLVLNRSSASIAASAIRGIPVVVNDWGLYLDFMQIVTREAEDFREMLFKDFVERGSFEGRI